MDTCLSIGFLILLALALVLPAHVESREVEQFIRMVKESLQK